MKKKSKSPPSAIQSPAKAASKKPRLVLAYDLGGTKVAIGVVDQAGNILKSHREPALIKVGKKETLAQLVKLGKRMRKEFPNIQAIGIASAGPLDPVKGLLLDPTNFEGPDGRWGVVPIAHILSKGIGLPCHLENDAASAILAESWKGHAKDFKNSMILTLGTGLGTGIICNGELVRSGNNLHTEAGHMIIRAFDESAPCGCGNLGCAEAYLSGRMFAHRARVKLKNPTIDAPQVAARARMGDKAALECFDEYAKLMAIALHNYLMMYGPEVIILTGSFAAAGDLFISNTESELKKLIIRREQSEGMTPKIVVSKLENLAGLLGGAYVAFQREKRMK